MRTVLRAALQSIVHLTRTRNTDVRRMRFAPNCNTSAGLEGPVGSSYEDYSVTKHMESGKHSGKASRDQVFLQATVWEAEQCLSLFQRCVKPYVYAVFFSYLVNRYPHGSFFTLRIN